MCQWDGSDAWASSYQVRLADDGLPVEQITLEFDGRSFPQREANNREGSAPEGSGVQVGFVSGQPAGSTFNIKIDGTSYPGVAVASDSGGQFQISEHIQVGPDGVPLVTKLPGLWGCHSVTLRQSPCADPDLYGWWAQVLAAGSLPPRKTVELSVSTGGDSVPIIRYLFAWPYSYTLKLADDGLPIEEYKIVFDSVELVL